MQLTAHIKIVIVIYNWSHMYFESGAGVINLFACSTQFGMKIVIYLHIKIQINETYFILRTVGNVIVSGCNFNVAFLKS